MIKQIFINLPVKDLNNTKEFFSKLGFTFNPQFTDENAAAMILGDNIFAMLITEPFFKTFTKKEIADTSKTTEVINAVSVDSRDKVDEMVNKAIEAGGIEYRELSDYGWMYSRSFQDPDGHQWEVLYMDITKAPAAPGK